MSEADMTVQFIAALGVLLAVIVLLVLQLIELKARLRRVQEYSDELYAQLQPLRRSVVRLGTREYLQGAPLYELAKPPEPRCEMDFPKLYEVPHAPDQKAL